MKKTIVAVAALAAALSCWSQDLTRSASVPTIDGSIGPGEYGWSMGGPQLKLHLSLSQDGATLYAAVAATTSGWVSAGLGSRRMNGAYIVMGADGRVLEQAGSGHSHADLKTGRATRKLHAAKDGSSILEFSVPAAAFVKDGTLDLIVAYGRSANPGSIHAGRGSYRVTVR